MERCASLARNPRNNADVVAKVAASIKEYGWRQPIVVDEERVIIAGHTRLMAAQRLGLPQYEPILYGWPEGAKHYWCGRMDVNTVWNVDKPKQFSCWNNGDPSRARMDGLDLQDRAFARAVSVASGAWAGDTTGGATHYHTTAIAPSWAAGHEPSARIGNHVFVTQSSEMK